MSMNELLAVVNSDPTIPINELMQQLFSYDSVTFNSSGTFTVPSGIDTIYITAAGGGGGGANGTSETGGAGGGGGAYVKSQKVSVTAGSSISITIGTGGAVGSNGGTTTIGSYFTLNGGYAAANGGAGGTGTGTGVLTGSAGASNSGRTGGNGGDSYGAGGTGSYSEAGTSGTEGGGGAGGSGNSTSSNRVGGAGGNGFCIIEYGLNAGQHISTVKSVQSGIANTTSSGHSITINSVNYKKSFAFAQGLGQSSKNGTSDYGCYFPSAQLINSNTLSVSGGTIGGSTTTNTIYVAWQVIEFY